VDALEKAGHPVVRINVADKMDIGQEMFRWEIATAVAGSILGINAFNQPDVEEAKIAARSLMATFVEKGSLPEERAALSGDGITLFTDRATSMPSPRRPVAPRRSRRISRHTWAASSRAITSPSTPTSR